MFFGQIYAENHLALELVKNWQTNQKIYSHFGHNSQHNSINFLNAKQTVRFRSDEMFVQYEFLVFFYYVVLFADSRNNVCGQLTECEMKGQIPKSKLTHNLSSFTFYVFAFFTLKHTTSISTRMKKRCRVFWFLRACSVLFNQNFFISSLYTDEVELGECNSNTTNFTYFTVNTKFSNLAGTQI